MTTAEKQKLKEYLFYTYQYYQRELADGALLMQVEDLEDLPFDKVSQALKDYRRDPKNTLPPLPAKIRAQICPEQVSEEDQARNAVSRLIEAVAKFGWTNSAGAKDHIGELGWLVVQREGGWKRICEGLNEDNLSTFRAQWRDLAISLCRMSKAGKLHEAPAIPYADRNQPIQSLVRSSVKSLT